MAGKYPSEVKAIIGLDWALPESYAHLTIHPQILRMAQVGGSQLGLLRYLPGRLYVPNANLSSGQRLLSTDSLSSNFCQRLC